MTLCKYRHFTHDEEDRESRVAADWFVIVVLIDLQIYLFRRWRLRLVYREVVATMKLDLEAACRKRSCRDVLHRSGTQRVAGSQTLLPVSNGDARCILARWNSAATGCHMRASVLIPAPLSDRTVSFVSLYSSGVFYRTLDWFEHRLYGGCCPVSGSWWVGCSSGLLPPAAYIINIKVPLQVFCS
jgi:hypothetical protein